MSCRVMEGWGTSPCVSWADPQLFPGTGWDGPKLCQERHRDVQNSPLCPVGVCREALGALLDNIPCKFQQEGRALEEHLSCRAGSLHLPGFPAGQTDMGTPVPGLAGPPEGCPQPPSRVTGPHGEIQDMGSSSRVPTAGTLSSRPSPKHQAPARGRGHILPREGPKLRLKGFPGKFRERKGQVEGFPHLWGSVTSWP